MISRRSSSARHITAVVSAVTAVRYPDRTHTHTHARVSSPTVPNIHTHTLPLSLNPFAPSQRKLSCSRASLASTTTASTSSSTSWAPPPKTRYSRAGEPSITWPLRLACWGHEVAPRPHVLTLCLLNSQLILSNVLTTYFDTISLVLRYVRKKTTPGWVFGLV